MITPLKSLSPNIITLGGNEGIPHISLGWGDTSIHSVTMCKKLRSSHEVSAPSMAGSSLPFTPSLNSVLVRVWEYVKSWDKNVNLTECSPLSHSQSNQGADSLTDNESGVDLSRGWKGGWRSSKEQMTLQLSLDQMVETARLEQYSRQREHHGQRHLWESMACSGTVRDLVCPEYSACVWGGIKPGERDKDRWWNSSHSNPESLGEPLRNLRQNGDTFRFIFKHYFLW